MTELLTNLFNRVLAENPVSLSMFLCGVFLVAGSGYMSLRARSKLLGAMEGQFNAFHDKSKAVCMAEAEETAKHIYRSFHPISEINCGSIMADRMDEKLKPMMEMLSDAKELAMDNNRRLFEILKSQVHNGGFENMMSTMKEMRADIDEIKRLGQK